MKLNASKTMTMIVSRSRTMHPQSPPLTIGGTVLKESNDHVILRVTFDSKMISESSKMISESSKMTSESPEQLRKDLYLEKVLASVS